VNSGLVILVAEAFCVYLLVLAMHSLRHRVGLAFFYALLGGLTAIMSWVTDAGVRVDVAGISFMVGSTVFYTSLLLGIFVVYIFDGVRATRVAIATVVGVSILMPVVAAVLHYQAGLLNLTPPVNIPVPSLRINTASVLTTMADLIFLAIAWEFLGKPQLKIPLWLRAYLTLLGVLWLDVLLFSTGAFAATENYLQIMQGTLLARLIVSVFAFPLLYAYLTWQKNKAGVEMAHRPVLAILTELKEIKGELNTAQREIEQRKKIEQENKDLIEQLQKTLSEVKTLRGMVPQCANCHRIRDDKGRWQLLDDYIESHSEAQVTHGICPECAKRMYPGLTDKNEEDSTP
jgi:uncharacterized PurR-regulated membrane protein YhhQ (DUF165 family)